MMTNQMPTYQHILYASDFGTHTRPVFHNAVALAKSTGARITMLHVVEPMGSTGQTVVGAYLPDMNRKQHEQEVLKEVLATLHKRLAKYCAEVPGSCNAESEIVEALEVASGLPSEEILRVAKAREADLIVLGTRTHAQMGLGAIGSTARKVLHNSPIPVLIVPNH
ncbi:MULTISPECIES: universal stress protein [Marichromatium]|nr:MULTISPECIES: universal stress protein [Marichromatium]MBK1708451.1 universal stress protein [Marichromatium gracile]MBO8087234.1 universal stress protein [Marichromatium sp.]RNE89735.1 universal stress protein [Marichromatium sp. AB31]RNE94313.1 universal stress protein [Marichromatium sp. AB32]